MSCTARPQCPTFTSVSQHLGTAASTPERPPPPMDPASSLHTKPSEETLASLLQLDPTPIADSPAANMDKPLPRLPSDADPEKAPSGHTGAEALSHRGTTGLISFRTSGHSLLPTSPKAIAMAGRQANAPPQSPASSATPP